MRGWIAAPSTSGTDTAWIHLLVEEGNDLGDLLVACDTLEDRTTNLSFCPDENDSHR